MTLLRPFALSLSLSVDDDVASFDIVLFRDKEAREEQLVIVSWMTTNCCNLMCAHCYQNADERNERELSTLEAKVMISQIAQAGFKVMIFSGGEPLLRGDIFELVEHAASCGLRPVFGTNGTLITPKAARRLKSAGACAMGISIDSVKREEHDSFRGVQGAYEAALSGIEACREARLPFQIHTTVTDWNREEICDITRFAKELGAMNHSIFFLVPVGRGADITDEIIGIEQNEKLLADILLTGREVGMEVKPTCAPQFMRIADQIGIETRYSRGCLAGLTYCVVGSEGIVRPCAYMQEVAGDVRSQPFDEIWRTSPLFQKLRTQAYKGSCGVCEYESVCGGCRARAAFYHDGDVLEQDDYCAWSGRAR